MDLSMVPLAEFVSRRTIGQAVVTIISEGTMRWAPQFPISENAWRVAMPEADAEGRIPLGLNLAHVRLGKASILIDPGFDEPGSAWRTEFAERWPGVIWSPGLGAWLADAGIGEEQITHVLITHAHADHFAGVANEQHGQLVARFPRAKHFVGRSDWDSHPHRHQPTSALAKRLEPVERLGLLTMVDAPTGVADGVVMLPAPGESPGHCVVRVQSGTDSFYFLGDLFHHACEVARPNWIPSQGRDPDAALASRNRLLPEMAAAGAVVVFSHAPFPGWGRIVAANEGYTWERD